MSRFNRKLLSNLFIYKPYNTLTISNSLNSVINPEKLALEHIKSGNVTTHLVINKILESQKVSIPENKPLIVKSVSDNNEIIF